MPTNREKYNAKYGFPKDAGHSMASIAKKTGISRSILQQVYNRGVGAHKTDPGSVRNVKGVKGGPGKKMSKEQWGMGRVYSFVMNGTTRRTTDKDLSDKIKKKK